MFKTLKVGDKVGVSTIKGQLPYELVPVAEVYEAFVGIGLSCDADGLFYRYSGKHSRNSTRHIVPEAQARLANKLIKEQNKQEYMATISWEFEQQIDRIKKLFYQPPEEPTIHQLTNVVNQLKDIS
jgi:hypothetical protein